MSGLLSGMLRLAAKRREPQAEGPKLKEHTSQTYEELVLSESATLGVALSVLIRLVFELEQGATFMDAKTLILKRTKSLKGNRSYESWLRANHKTRHSVGKAEYFISYCWSTSFEDTIEAIAEHFERLGHHDPFIWMDIVMVDQHGAMKETIDFNVWVKTFRSNLISIGKALIVMIPGDKPVAVGRSWCCYEWVCIKETGIPFEYCAPTKDTARILLQMKSGTFGVACFIDIFAAIDVELATAFKASDQDMILQLLRIIGVKLVNDMITMSMKDWFLKLTELALERAVTGTWGGTNIIAAKASLHQALGEYDEARSFFEQAIHSAREMSPTDIVTVATCLNNLGWLLQKMGDYDGADSLYRESLAIRRKVLGDEHEDTAQSLNNFASLLQARGEFDEAEPLYREALSIMKTSLGDYHPDTAQSLNNFASLLQARGDFEAAESVSREALAVRSKVLGRNHPDWAQSLNNFASLLQARGELEEAEPLFRAALEVREKVLGRDHPDTAQSISNLASLLQAKGEYEQAEPLYREALSIRKKALGDYHPDTVQSLNRLASLLPYGTRD